MPLYTGIIYPEAERSAPRTFGFQASNDAAAVGRMPILGNGTVIEIWLGDRLVADVQADRIAVVDGDARQPLQHFLERPKQPR